MLLNESLIISYSTPNYENLTNIFLKSLASINVTNIDHYLDKSDMVKDNITGFQTNLWYYSVTNKIKHLNNVLLNGNNSNYNYFIFSDCDIWFIKKNKSEWNNLQKYIDENDNDIYFMREKDTDDVNSGFFIIKNNGNIKTIKFFFREVYFTMLKEAKKDMPYGDQTIINNLKDKINYGYIPNEYVIFADKVYDRNKSLFHHATCCKDVKEKIVQINNIKLLF